MSPVLKRAVHSVTFLVAVTLVAPAHAIVVTLTGTLFAQGATVHVTATGVDASYNATVNSPTSATISNLSLANVPAGQYTVTVVNPGPHASGSVALHVEWPDGGG